MNGRAIQTRGIRGARPWRIAQTIAVGATVAVVVGLVLEPDLTLGYLWGLIIPLVPASLLVSPMLWRNVCPLATLNTLPRGAGSRREIGARSLVRLSILGMILLGVLVSLRHVLFNGHNPSDGLVLAAVVTLVAIAAFVLGLFYTVKVGFCNSLCPVLPVERLYGQSPLLEVNNPRCPVCTTCTAKGCIDLGPESSIPLVIGRHSRNGPKWVLSSYGIFAAAFPGFVLGYYVALDGPLHTVGQVFLQVGLWTVTSYLIVAILARFSKAPAVRFMPALAGVAAGVYYWFAAPIIARTLGLGNPSAVVLRAATFALIAWWLWRAYARQRTVPASARPWSVGSASA